MKMSEFSPTNYSLCKIIRSLNFARISNIFTDIYGTKVTEISKFLY